MIMIEKKWKNGKNIEPLLMLIILTLFFAMHVFKISQVPNGINIDEMGMAIDAWSIANFGHDRFQNSFPLYLVNYGFGQSTLYCYLTAFFIKIFGFKLWVIRLPAIIFSAVTLIFGMKIIQCRFPKAKYYKYILGIFYLILPYFTMQSRFGLDCNIMLGMSTLFLYYLIKAMKNEKNLSFFVAGCLAGFTLYTYILSYLIMPLFLILILIVGIYLKKINFINIISFAIPLMILAVPLVITQIINMFELETMHLGIFTLPRLIGYRSDEMSLSNIVNSFILVFRFVFFEDGIVYNAMRKFYTFYPITIPFVICGGILCAKNSIRKLLQSIFTIDIVIFTWFISVFSIALFLEYPNINRLNSIYYSLLYFLILFITNFIKINISFKKIITSIFVLFYIGYFILFANEYFSKTDTYDWLFANPSNKVSEICSENEKIVWVDYNYTYFLGNNIDILSANEINEISTYQQFKNLFFYLPEDIVDGDYIISKNNVYYRLKLENEGYTAKEWDKNYDYFTKIN